MARKRPQNDPEYTIDCPTFNRRDLGSEVLTAQIAFLDDAHTDNECSDLDGLIETRDTILETPNFYSFIGGDVLENALHTSKSASYRTKMGPEAEQEWVFNEVLLPLGRAGRILGVTNSNHSIRSDKATGIDPIQQLVMRTNLELKGIAPLIPYERGGIWVGVTLGKRKNNGKPFCYGVFYHHGWAAGRSEGAALNAVSSIPKWLHGTDVVVVGHAHAKTGTKLAAFEPDWTCGQFRKRRIAAGITGSYMLWGSYGRERGYAPKEEGATVVKLSGKRKEVKIVL